MECLRRGGFNGVGGGGTRGLFVFGVWVVLDWYVV